MSKIVLDQTAATIAGETGKRKIVARSDGLYQIDPSGVETLLAVTDSDNVPEGASNLYFTAARVRAAVLTGLSTASNTVVTAAHTVLQAIGFLQKQITDHKADTANPHSVTKTQVGLSNVPNIDCTNASNITTGTLLAANGGVPSGMVNCFAMSTPPIGWLECDGSAISRSTYATLFSLIGTTFGAGNGSTTFNIPDLRGEFIRGWDHGRGVDSGRSFGSAQADQFQGHYHSTDAQKINNGSNLAGGTAVIQGSASVTGPITDGTNGTPRTGSETRPRNIALMYCIKV